MMPSPVRFTIVKAILDGKGYSLARISGSHHIFTKAGQRHQTIPVHHGKVKYVYYKNAQNAP
jgi:predicted RNA binding protein YcfA (HicA-like mRNA interferase family)